MGDSVTQSEILHASAVSVRGRGLLILGRSGSGKSALALDLMSRGATLISDDRTVLTLTGGEILLSAPDQLRGMIEARFVGLLHADVAQPTELKAIVDLDVVEHERLPPYRQKVVMGCQIPLIHAVPYPNFAPVLIQYLSAGRKE